MHFKEETEEVITIVRTDRQYDHVSLPRAVIKLWNGRPISARIDKLDEAHKKLYEQKIKETNKK